LTDIGGGDSDDDDIAVQMPSSIAANAGVAGSRAIIPATIEARDKQNNCVIRVHY
jgi:hypothetical protein